MDDNPPGSSPAEQPSGPEVPPVLQAPPVAPPSQQYAEYPRGAPQYGSADKLEQLAQGYFGLSQVFLLNFLLAIVSLAVVIFEPSAAVPILIAWQVVTAVVVGYASYPQIKKIGEAAVWGKETPVVGAILLGFGCVFCSGVIGFSAIQSIAAKEMKKYGVRHGMFGITKKEVERVLQEMRARGH